MDGATTDDVPPTPAPLVVPPALYLPRMDEGGPEGTPRYVVRTARDGRRVLLAYTALDRLARCCGGRQPWMLVTTAGLDEVMAGQHFDTVVLDLEVPEHEREQERVR